MEADNPSLTLANLLPGQRARIDNIDSEDPAVQRLMVLGLVEGAELTFRASALGGDPLEFRLYGGTLSLRRDQARHFSVTAVGTDE